ncbi:uncharacterized protein LOC129606576 [Condylostylus longicornis]|uniref:uncharacterized protein LOC129606576 n=1 Tax=Condylostylus longicornis TaxID=2530218 RepID=UPI00244DC64F|nr:uncharacterized protein LOC129606576 [Condylostylus longicornis]
MTTPTHHLTRQALSEIPERLGRIRVATTPTTRIPDEPTPANVLNTTIFDNTLTNISRGYYISPIPSPDELVIRQRGRRRISLVWSPEKNVLPTGVVSSRSPFPKTPTKIGCSSMTLRSSPRKRLMNDFIANESCERKNFSPKKNINEESSNRIMWCGTPVVKRQKLDERPLAQANFEIPLHLQLKGLTQDQLIEIIKGLVKDDPNIGTKIRDNFPMPDLSSVEDELLNIKRNIFKSLPTSRLCKKTDGTAYSRAVIHLTAFKKALVSQSRCLNDSGHWDALLNYVSMAWNYVRATPIWDNNSHNIIRRQCFKILTSQCAAALKNGGTRLGEQRLVDLERDIKEWSKDYEDILSCVGQLSQILLKLRST